MTDKRHRRLRPDWIALLDGWRLITVTKVGRKWTYVTVCATGETLKFDRREWCDLNKRPVYRKHALWDEPGPHITPHWGGP